MPDLSENQQLSLVGLRAATIDRGITYASKAVWKKSCPPKASVHASVMVRTGTVIAVKAAVSTNGKVIELYTPAAIEG